MKKLIFGLFVLLGGIFFLSSCEELSSFLSEDETAAGLREALTVGTDTSVTQTNKTDGFYGNLAIKILFPQEASVIESTLSSIPGGSSLLNALVLKLNRAAESASSEARPIFKQTISNITFDDALAILQGSNYAATEFLENNSREPLYTSFYPKIENAMASVGADAAWSEVTNTYNSIPLVTPVNTDISDYTTNKALDGLFHLIGEEEQKIRQDPVHRVTELLQKVFGSQ